MGESSLQDRLYRALLRLFPREFRGDFGDQMVEDFRDQRENLGGRGTTRDVRRLWIRTTIDILRRAPVEHLDVLRRDGGYAVRLFRRDPSFAVAVVLTLAVGVGSTTAVFTLADPILLRPLPYPEPERLVAVRASVDGISGVLHVPDFLRAESSHRAFEAIAEFGPAVVGHRLAGRIETPLAYAVTSGFFDVLRVRPFIGREFLPDEYQPNEQGDAAILAYGFWRSAFGGRADILTQSLNLEPNDAVTFGAACLLVVCVVLLASLIPARRASRMDPVVALRIE